MKYTEQERLEFARNHKWLNPEPIIGKHVFIHSTAVVGEAGFGYVRDENNNLIAMPHAGGIVIGDGVCIAALSCVDRAVVGNTVIGDDTKIDHHVHVAHGVQIGKRCLIVAGAVLGGSCEIGDDCFIGMGALIKNKIKVGKNCVIGMGAVVTKDVPDGETWVGNPARKL